MSTQSCGWFCVLFGSIVGWVWSLTAKDHDMTMLAATLSLMLLGIAYLIDKEGR